MRLLFIFILFYNIILIICTNTNNDNIINVLYNEENKNNFNKLMKNFITLLYSPDNGCTNCSNAGNQYCITSNAEFISLCVPYCDKNSGKNKKYINKIACYKKLCFEDFRCNKECCSGSCF